MPLNLKRAKPDPEPEPPKPTPPPSNGLEEQSRAIGMFRDFAAAFRSIGASFYSDDMCGRLLSYAALSGSEDVVTNTKLCAAILCAQDQFNIKGGEIPDMARLVYWRKAMQDLRDTGTRSEWWGEFAGRYDIDPKRWKLLDENFKANFVYFEGAMTAKKVGRIRGDDPDDATPVHVSRMARLRE